MDCKCDSLRGEIEESCWKCGRSAWEIDEIMIDQYEIESGLVDMKKERLYYNEKRLKEKMKNEKRKNEKRKNKKKEEQEMEAYDGDSEEIDKNEEESDKNEDRKDNEMEPVEFVTVYIKDVAYKRFCK